MRRFSRCSPNSGALIPDGPPAAAQLILAAMPQRRFPRPWRFEPIPGGYRVIDANGLALAAPPAAKAATETRYLGLLYRYAIEHATVIYTPNATRLVRQHRLDGGPLMIADIIRAPVGELELRERAVLQFTVAQL